MRENLSDLLGLHDMQGELCFIAVLRAVGIYVNPDGKAGGTVIQFDNPETYAIVRETPEEIAALCAKISEWRT